APNLSRLVAVMHQDLATPGAGSQEDHLVDGTLKALGRQRVHQGIPQLSVVQNVHRANTPILNQTLDTREFPLSLPTPAKGASFACRTAFLLPAEGLRRLAGQPVTALVLFVPRVPLHLDPLDG